MRRLRVLANRCGRWLQWYGHMVLPTLVAAVYNAATGANGNGSSGTADGVDPAPTVADAARLLTDRDGVDPTHARKVLAAIAAKRGVSLHALAAQLTAKIDQPAD